MKGLGCCELGEHCCSLSFVCSGITKTPTAVPPVCTAPQGKRMCCSVPCIGCAFLSQLGALSLGCWWGAGHGSPVTVGITVLISSPRRVDLLHWLHPQGPASLPFTLPRLLTRTLPWAGAWVGDIPGDNGQKVARPPRESRLTHPVQ